ncbi:MAG: Coenzyme F420 hydrogenase/dehydrogenase, beta subunit C-terminal domain [Candidatus Geothermarchaeales archaeon]
MSEKEGITFEDLSEDVIEAGICAVCHGCVSFCSAGALNALTMRGDKPVYLNKDNCLKCGICYMICPRTKHLDDAVKTRFDFEPPIGSYLQVRCLRTTDEEVRRVCCDGGVVTGILKFLLDTERIDGAVISRRESFWNNQPMLATTFEDLLEGAGISLSQSASIEDLGDYTTYIPTLTAVKGLRDMDVWRVAVVGTPCQIETIRKMQVLRIVPSHLVRFTIGLFCFENFSFHEEGREFLRKKIGARLRDVTKINIKDDFIVRLRDDETIHIDLEDLGDIVRPGCLPCTDFSNFAADMSVGGLGSPEGYTTTILRSQQSLALVEKAIKRGYLEEIDQEGMIESINDFALRKRRRGERLLKEKGMI